MKLIASFWMLLLLSFGYEYQKVLVSFILAYHKHLVPNRNNICPGIRIQSSKTNNVLEIITLAICDIQNDIVTIFYT